MSGGGSGSRSSPGKREATILDELGGDEYRRVAADGETLALRGRNPRRVDTHDFGLVKGKNGLAKPAAMRYCLGDDFAP